ncbi:hypothetical protein LCDV1gp079 [Lymphocystis disease virus 1]|uniref:hypothetical protein n=1 Tax=Fish lymphocystis disease virus TaxID=36363 RepID=UPI0000161ED9|nr:hypothetical protein LCDV1gp079 [Lymphocystis disease virus 1]
MVFFPSSSCTSCTYFKPCKQCLQCLTLQDEQFLQHTIFRKILKFKYMIQIIKQNNSIMLNGIVSKYLWQLQLELNTLKQLLKPFYTQENLQRFNVPVKYDITKNPLLCLIRCIRSVVNLQLLISPIILYNPNCLNQHLNLLLYITFEESLYITSIALEYKPFFNDMNIVQRLSLNK